MQGIAFFHFALLALQGAGDSLAAHWSAWSQPAAALALTAMWQGAAVALGLAICLRLAPRSPARHRFALWAAGFGVLVGLQVLPLLSYLIPVPFQAAASATIPVAAFAPAQHPWLQINAAWSLLIASLWLAASLYRAVGLAVHSLRLRKLWQSATPVEIDPASLPRSLSRVSCRRLQICTTRDLERPSVIGFFAPRILIPEWLFARLTSGELDQIVLHETEHLRRRDDWTNLLQKLCLVLFPLNPGLAWIERRLCREREMACDDGVIGITRAPRAYAACLASLAERGLQHRAGALSLGAWHARPELVRRVHSILRCKHALNPVAARAVLSAVACVLLAGATALARCPRLIAFVPSHSPAAAQPAPKLESKTAMAAQNSAPSESQYKLRAAKPEKVATETHPAIRRHRIAAVSGATWAEDSAPEFAALASEGNMLRLIPAAAPAPAHQSAFIVMSAWESVEVQNPESGRNEAADVITSRDKVRASGSGGAASVQQVSPRISVTRMYLKIYSSGGRESAWLVIQL